MVNRWFPKPVFPVRVRVPLQSIFMKKVITAIVLLILVMIGIFVFTSSTEDIEVICTKEARLCPDGSAVGRIGPDCEFAECP